MELRNKFNTETKGGGSDTDYIAWLEEKLSKPHYSVEPEHLDELLGELNVIAQFIMRSEENADDTTTGTPGDDTQEGDSR